MANPHPDQFSEVKKTGWLSRIGGSLVGFLLGLVLIPASIASLVWNEHRAVQALNALERGLGATVTISSSAIDEKNDQRLVYLTGALTSAATAMDPATKFSVKHALRLQREVMMYQWVEQVSEKVTNQVGGSQITEKVYDYTQAWVSTPQHSQRFKVPVGHHNPPMPLQSEVFNASPIKLGAFTLDPSFVEKIDQFEAVTDLGPAPPGYQLSANTLYRGKDPTQAEIGDLRITYQAVITTDYSIVAKQSKNVLVPYKDSESGYVIALLEAGQLSLQKMFTEQSDMENLLTWMLRLGGLLFVFMGLRLLFGPIEMLAAVVPFLQSIVGFSAGIIAFLLAIPITLITIALAWIYVRPLLGIGLFLLSLITLLGLRALIKNKSTH